MDIENNIFSVVRHQAINGYHTVVHTTHQYTLILHTVWYAIRQFTELSAHSYRGPTFLNK